MKDFLDKFKFLWRQVPPRYKRHYILYTLISFIHAAVFLILPFIFKEVVDAFVRGEFSTQITF